MKENPDKIILNISISETGSRGWETGRLGDWETGRRGEGEKGRIRELKMATL
jgi:hypothetical protein